MAIYGLFSFPLKLLDSVSDGSYDAARHTWHNIAQHGVSHHITSHHITSHHIISHHITSQHITAHHSTSQHSTAQRNATRHLTLVTSHATSCPFGFTSSRTHRTGSFGSSSVITQSLNFAHIGQGQLHAAAQSSSTTFRREW
jgi:hypothetical protein